MPPEVTDWARLAETIGELSSELKRLGERLTALETAAATKASPVSQTPDVEKTRAGDAAPQGNILDEELILVISAAIAAFLGKKPHIRQIQLLGHAAWAQEGRVMIQASHRLSVPHN
jgi:methylmalonyl-CoA carboxyltransferase large subunit